MGNFELVMCEKYVSRKQTKKGINGALVDCS